MSHCIFIFEAQAAACGPFTMAEERKPSPAIAPLTGRISVLVAPLAARIEAVHEN
jgi:hypothetical protein